MLKNLLFSIGKSSRCDNKKMVIENHFKAISISENILFRDIYIFGEHNINLSAVTLPCDHERACVSN